MPIEITSMEEAARLYRKVEAVLETKAAEYEAATKKEKDALKQLEVIMRAMLNQAGVGKMDVPGVAEVVIVPKRTFSNSDWDRFYDWVVENNCPELFIKRLHEGNMQYWIDEQEKRKVADPTYTYELPPGVNVFTEHTLKVHKSKVKE